MTQAAPVQEEGRLKRALGPVMLWGLGVGYVISGEYFGWNLGLPAGGTLGMLLAFVLITVMYVTFVFSYTELACAIPRAGGVFVYAQRALGQEAGYLGGIAQAVEFTFAPPAIAMAIGDYVQIWIPDDWIVSFSESSPIDMKVLIALVAYLIFTGLNIWGVRQAATFELAVTVAAVAGLVLFSGLALPHFRLENFLANGWPQGWWGVFAAIPFAMWFYLAIEGVANAAEEALNPQRDVSRGFGAAIVTLVVLACCVFFGSVGIGGWERVVYTEANVVATAAGGVQVNPDALATDRPLPLAMQQLVGASHGAYHLLVGIGLLGLLASFNGIILASGRALFEMGRVGYFFPALGRTNARTKTPVNALLVNFAIGAVAVLFLDTAGLITMASFGALTLYLVAMVALMRLRTKEPDLPRQYKTPCYPVFPWTALVIAFVSLVTMSVLNFDAGDLLRSYTLWYFGYVAAAFAYFFVFLRGRLPEAPAVPSQVTPE